MPGKQAFWTNGVNIVVETPTWSVQRQGSGTTVRPSPNNTSGWVNFTIPTPVVLNDTTHSIKAALALVKFSTSNASIKIFQVYDSGEKPFYDKPRGLEREPKLRNRIWDVNQYISELGSVFL